MGAVDSGTPRQFRNGPLTGLIISSRTLGELGHSCVQLLIGKVFLVGADVPPVPEWVHQGTGSVDPKLVFQGHQALGPGRDGLGVNTAHVCHVEIDMHPSVPNGLRTAEIHLGAFVENHDFRIANLYLGEANGPIGTWDSHQFFCVESCLTKCYGVRRTLDAQVRGCCVTAL